MVHTINHYFTGEFKENRYWENQCHDDGISNDRLSDEKKLVRICNEIWDE